MTRSVRLEEQMQPVVVVSVELVVHSAEEAFIIKVKWTRKSCFERFSATHLNRVEVSRICGTRKVANRLDLRFPR